MGSRLESNGATGVNGPQGTSASNSGAAYVFHRTGSAWVQQAYLKASNTDPNDEFGQSVAVSNDTIAVASTREASNAVGIQGDQLNNDAFGSGAVYVFGRAGSTWSQVAYVKSSNAEFNDRFGASVALSGNTMIAGAFGEGSFATGVNGNQADNSAQGAGAAYVFNLGIGFPYCGPGISNSLGVPALIDAAGSAAVSDNQLTLSASQLPTATMGYFLVSPTSGLIQNPGSSVGSLCLAGSIGRFAGPQQVQHSGPTGAFTLALDLTQIPQPFGNVSVVPGDTWYFQAWYRDTILGVQTSNFTNGYAITFE